jgi:hypothetical protein
MEAFYLWVTLNMWSVYITVPLAIIGAIFTVGKFFLARAIKCRKYNVA